MLYSNCYEANPIWDSGQGSKNKSYFSKYEVIILEILLLWNFTEHP